MLIIKSKRLIVLKYRIKGQNSNIEIWLAEIKIRARRRVAEIIKELDKSKANQHVQLPIAGISKKQTLENAGLTTSVANRCEKIAEIPREEFNKPAMIATLKNRVKNNSGGTYGGIS